MRSIFTMRRFMCLRYYAEAKVLRCSHLSKALVVNEEKCSQSRMFRANVRVFLARFSYFNF